MEPNNDASKGAGECGGTQEPVVEREKREHV